LLIFLFAKTQVKAQLDADQIASPMIEQKPRLNALGSKSFLAALISVPFNLKKKQRQT